MYIVNYLIHLINVLLVHIKSLYIIQINYKVQSLLHFVDNLLNFVNNIDLLLNLDINEELENLLKVDLNEYYIYLIYYLIKNIDFLLKYNLLIINKEEINNKT